MPLEVSPPFLSQPGAVEVTEAGREFIDGRLTTKSKVLVSNGGTTFFDGFIWTTPENIVIKTEGVSVIGENKLQMKSELLNLKIGEQDSSLFEIPKDYTSLQELINKLSDEDKKKFNDQMKSMMGIFGLASPDHP